MTPGCNNFDNFFLGINTIIYKFWMLRGTRTLIKSSWCSGQSIWNFEMKIFTVCYCMQGRQRVKKSGGQTTLPAPSLSSSFPPISPFSSPSLTSRPFKIQLVGLRERSKLPQRGLGRHMLSLGNGSEGSNFNDFTVFFTDFVLLLLYGCNRFWGGFLIFRG